MSSDSSIIPFSRSLPLELECEIFELTAKMHRGNAVRLVLIAHRVHAWITPILYDMLTISSLGSKRLLLGDVGDRFAKYTKTLCLTQMSYSAALLQVARFQALVNLAIWVFPDELIVSGTTLLVALENKHLKRLSASTECLRNPSLSWSSRVLAIGYPVFSQLTHLELMAYDDDDWSVICGLTALPHLSHLGYLFEVEHYNVPTPGSLIKALQMLLSTSNTLKVLALFVSVYEEPEAVDIVRGWLHKAQLDDPRLVVLSPDVDDLYAEWESGEQGMWAWAEDMVQEQKLRNSRYSNTL